MQLYRFLVRYQCFSTIRSHSRHSLHSAISTESIFIHVCRKDWHLSTLKVILDCDCRAAIKHILRLNRFACSARYIYVHIYCFGIYLFASCRLDFFPPRIPVSHSSQSTLYYLYILNRIETKRVERARAFSCKLHYTPLLNRFLCFCAKIEAKNRSPKLKRKTHQTLEQCVYNVRCITSPESCLCIAIDTHRERENASQLCTLSLCRICTITITCLPSLGDALLLDL